MATVKQKLAFKKTLENNGSVSKAMREAKYAPGTAKNPKILTESKGWQELMQQHLPDNSLAKKHRQMLNKTEKIVVSDGNQSGSHIEDTGQPHSDVNKALDMAYKLKRLYPQEQGGNTLIAIQITPETALRYGVSPIPEDDSSR